MGASCETTRLSKHVDMPRVSSVTKVMPRVNDPVSLSEKILPIS